MRKVRGSSGSNTSAVGMEPHQSNTMLPVSRCRITSGQCVGGVMGLRYCHQNSTARSAATMYPNGPVCVQHRPHCRSVLIVSDIGFPVLLGCRPLSGSTTCELGQCSARMYLHASEWHKKVAIHTAVGNKGTMCASDHVHEWHRVC